MSPKIPVRAGHSAAVTAMANAAKTALQPAQTAQPAAPTAEPAAAVPQESVEIAQLPGQAQAPTVNLHGDHGDGDKATTQTAATGKVKAQPPTKTVKVSAYGPGLYGNKTANGTRLSPTTVGLAHKTLPLGTKVDVIVNGQTVTAKVIDRGPYEPGREFDLTAGLIKKLGFASCDDFGVRKISVRIHR